MINRTRIHYSFAILAMCQWIFPLSPLLGDELSKGLRDELKGPALKINDVALSVRGSLTGQIVDAQGQAKVGCRLTIDQVGREISEVKTDKQGHFQVDGMRGGICRLKTSDGEYLVRCWPNEAAPPSAKPSILVVSDKEVVRGQRPISAVMTNPLIVGMTLTAAVAVPVAVATARQNPPGS